MQPPSIRVITAPSSIDALQYRTRSCVGIIPNPVGPLVVGAPAPSCDLIFAGSLYGPNRHGLEWFFREVWPQVLRICNPTFRIVGEGLTREQVVSRVPPGRVDFLGRVPNVLAHLEAAKLHVCPIFYGSGTPNKAVEAAAVGTPTLTTDFVRTRLPYLEFRVPKDIAGWVAEITRAVGIGREHQQNAASVARAIHGSKAFEAAVIDAEGQVLLP